MQQENRTEQTLIVRVACHSQSLNQQRDAALVRLLSDTVFPLVPCAEAHHRISQHGRLNRPFSHQQREEARRIRTVHPASQVAREVVEEPCLVVRELGRHVIRWNSKPKRDSRRVRCARCWRGTQYGESLVELGMSIAEVGSQAWCYIVV